MTKLDRMRQVKISIALRTLLQIGFFLLVPSAYTAAFGGIKYIFTQLGAGEAVGMTPFLAALIVLCGYTVVFGRFFCGYACAFGSLGDWIYALHIGICKLRKKKPKKIGIKVMEAMSMIKYLILAAIAVMCFLGVYGKAQGTSPWDVFAQIHARTFQLNGYWVGGILLGFIVICMFVQERFFCRVLCPMGAVFALLPALPFLTLKRKRTECVKGCSACARKCPADIELPEMGSLQVKGDCFQCGKCVHACPKGNVRCGGFSLTTLEIPFTLAQGVILVGLCVWIGI